MVEMLPQFVVNGVLAGGTYALIGLGIVLIFKATGVFNFAVGQFFLLGAYICWSFIVWAGLPVWASLMLTLAGMAVLGFAVERTVLRPLLGQPILTSIMATVGLMVLFGAIASFIWGTAPSAYPVAIFPETTFTIGRIIVSNDLLCGFLIAMFGIGALVAFFRCSRVGLAMRATAEDQQLARATGVNVMWIFGLTWAIAAVVATLPGVLMASRSGLGVNETPLMALAVFPVVILGGLDSILGIIAAGLIMGLAENLVGGLISPKLATITPYLILLITLIIKPEGLFGLKRIERV